MVQQPLYVGWHRRGLRNVGASGVEASLVSLVLDTDLLTLRGQALHLSWDICLQSNDWKVLKLGDPLLDNSGWEEEGGGGEGSEEVGEVLNEGDVEVIRYPLLLISPCIQYSLLHFRGQYSLLYSLIWNDLTWLSPHPMSTRGT